MPLSYWARTDSNSANNPALNLAGDEAVQLLFVNETPWGGSGDFELEYLGGEVDPDTLVQINGTTYSFTYEFTGIMPTMKSDGAQQVPDQYEGSKVAVISVQDYPASGETTRLAFLIDDQASQAEMEAFGKGAIDVQALDESPPPTVVCFARGTLILTPDGERPIEDLVVGDLVMTAGGAAAAIHHITYQKFSGLTHASDTSILPVRIKQDSSGAGQPHRDLVVSPNHRISLSHWALELLFGSERVFCPAKLLPGSAARQFVPAGGKVEYYNLLLAEHLEIVANGMAVESLFPGGQVIEGLSGMELHKLKDAISRLHLGYRPDLETALPTITRKEMQVFESYAGFSNPLLGNGGGIALAA